jgi:hypothetical protein
MAAAGAALTSLALVSCPVTDLRVAAAALTGHAERLLASGSSALALLESSSEPTANTAAGSIGNGLGVTHKAAQSPSSSGRGAHPHPTVDPDLALAATARETLVLARPSWSAPKLGYLRAGAVVRRAPDPAGYGGCAAGWYRIEPRGYVCVGKTATVDPTHPIVATARRRPDRSAPLPYAYGRSRQPTPPFYTRVPTQQEQVRVESGPQRRPRSVERGGWDSASFGEVPELLRDGGAVPSLNGYVHSRDSLYTGRALADSGFAFLALFEAQGRRFGLSTDFDVMPLSRLRPVQASEFRGLALDEQMTLPVVFVRSRHASLYRRDGDQPHAALRVERRLRYREAIPIRGRRIRIGGAWYLETREGGWLRDTGLLRVDPMPKYPSWATPGRTWIDVSILRQVLVAYEGTEPVYVTLVCTGADGLGDPEKSHSTIRGRFLIHTKHVTATMSGDEVGDEFDLRDVPYVQYFTQGYALHAAYWHDDFGRPRSHGCINLAPFDAQWLFEWTDPPVPPAWHGAMTLHDGTLVSVHP